MPLALSGPFKGVVGFAKAHRIIMSSRCGSLRRPSRHETAKILRKVGPAPSLLWLAKLNVHKETGKSLLLILAVRYAGRAGWVTSVTNSDMRGRNASF